MDKTVIVAVIAASASIAAALIAATFSALTGRTGRRAAQQLEDQKARLSKDIASETARLAQITADRNARRDYEYDARKRLYTEIEPLLFELYEALEEAHNRVRSLARTSRHGNLPSWLNKGAYYLNSTAYKLILPAVFLRLIQRQMTFVDLRVDQTIRTRYQLLKLYSRSFTDDFVYASLDPPLHYDPNNSRGKPSQTNHRADTRQALFVGNLESICEQMIVAGSNNAARAMSFSEFKSALSNPPRGSALNHLLSLLTGFSPEDRPILARLLVSQAVMAQLILSTYGQETPSSSLHDHLKAIVLSRTAQEKLSWRQGVPCADLPIAYKYWEERLRCLSPKNSWIEVDK